MRLLLTGLSHKTAPIQLREQLAIAERALPRALHELQRHGAAEAVVLSTCNRVEFTVSTPDHLEPGPVVDRFLAEWEFPPTAFDGHLYRLESRAAIQHIFRVASSLDSMVVGEPQILGQMKAAYAAAKQEGSVGGILETVLTRAFNAGQESQVGNRYRADGGFGKLCRGRTCPANFRIPRGP